MSVDQQVPAPPQGQSPPDDSRDWVGVVALVTGLVGLGVVALVAGALGLRAVRQGRATNRGVAVAGLVLGAIGTLVGVGVGLAVIVDQDEPVAVDVPAGATRFVLAPDGSSDPALLDAAAALLAARLDADVRVDAAAGSIVVDFGQTPAGPHDVEELTRPGAAQLRPVVVLAQPEPSVSDWPAASVDQPSWAGDAAYFATGDAGRVFDATDCTDPAHARADTSHPEAGVVACHDDASAKYLLGAAVLAADDIAGIAVDGTTVLVTFTSAGSKAFADLTGQLARQSSPGNQVALVADGYVRSAPTVMAPVPGRVMQVSGLPDEAGAEALAGALAFGSHLMTLTLQSAS